jgi:virginiamycin A acetyltransferase
MIRISETAKVSQLADIEPSVRGTQIVIEDGVMIDSFVKIKPAGGKGDVRIGKRSYINSGVVIYSGNGVEIGEDVLIAANCTFAPVDHEFRSKNKKIIEQRFRPSKGGIIIEDDVWIGAGCVILDGARIRKGAVIGALSLVKGEVAPYTVHVGNPLQQVGERV